jgi:hypothetical protein
VFPAVISWAETYIGKNDKRISDNRLIIGLEMYKRFLEYKNKKKVKKSLFADCFISKWSISLRLLLISNKRTPMECVCGIGYYVIGKLEVAVF